MPASSPSIPSSGAVSLSPDPDFETKASYLFTVVATDAAGNSTPKDVTLIINNLDEVAPTITSGTTGATVAENSTGTVVYTAIASDTDSDTNGGITYSIAGTDASSFSIDRNTGLVTQTSAFDFETPQTSYSFTVVATDAASNASNLVVVTGSVSDVDEVASTATSVSTSTADGSYGIGAVITLAVGFSEPVTVSGTPSLQLETGNIDRFATYSSGSGTNTLSFQYTVQAGDNATDLDQLSATALTLNGGSITDAAGNDAILTLAAPGTVGSLGANADLVIDTSAPVFTSSGVATAINENSGAAQNVYTAAATDSGAVAYSLASSADASLFSIDSSSGAVSLSPDPDFETKASYLFTVVATDAAGNSTPKDVTLIINNLDEVAPTITSGTTGATVAENSTGTVVYTAIASDTDSDTNGGITYSIAGTDASSFSIDRNTGLVTQTSAFDFETPQTSLLLHCCRHRCCQ